MTNKNTAEFDPKAYTQEAREVWNKASSNYDQKIAGKFFDGLANETLGWAQLKPGEKVLDVACGPGIVTLKAGKAVGSQGKVTGTDLSPEMLALAGKKAQTAGLANIDFKEMNAEAMTLPDNSFDAVLCQLGIMLFADGPAAIKEMRRVLKPGGRLVAAVQGTAEKMVFTSAIQKAVIKRAPHLKVPGAPTMYTYGPAGVLEDAFKKAGFDKVETKRLEGVFPFPSFEDYWETVIGGAGKTKAMFESLTPVDQKGVFEEVQALAKTLRKNSHVEIPYEFVLARGWK